MKANNPLSYEEPGTKLDAVLFFILLLMLLVITGLTIYFLSKSLCGI